MRARLGLDLERPCVLIVGGGDGVGPISETARAICAQVPGVQLVVVCGHNERLRKQLEAIEWEVPVRIDGFVDNMPRIDVGQRFACDQGRPGTLAEAFIAGLPVIIFGYTPGQETANVDYVLEHRAGAFATEPTEIARIVGEWLEPDNKDWERVVANAAGLARPDATVVIARQLYTMLHRGPALHPGSSDLQRLEARLSND